MEEEPRLPKTKSAPVVKKEATATHSLWTAPQSTWKRSLDGIKVKASSLRRANERKLSDRLKPFETTVDPKSLVRFVYD